MAASNEDDANENRELTELNADLQLRLDKAAENLATKQAEQEELRKKLEKARARHEAGVEKLRKMGYRLENNKAVPMFHPKAILDEYAPDIKITWEEFRDRVADCDRRFSYRLLSVFYRLAAEDDHNLNARLKSYKEYLNAKAKDITECKKIELK